MMPRDAAPSRHRQLIRMNAHDLIGLRGYARGLLAPGGPARRQQAGPVRSAFRGRGMEFDESRPYQAGDDLRSLDWRVMARTGQPHTKLFREERERPVLVCVDLRSHMFFATRGAYKSVAAVEAAGLLAWAAVDHGDRVGGVVFTDHSFSELRPQRGPKAALRLIHALQEAQPMDARFPDAGPLNAPFDRAMGRLARVARPGSLVAVVSDFLGFGPAEEARLLRVARHSDLALVFVHDPLEQALPPPGLYRICGPQGERLLDTRSSRARDAHHRRFKDRCERLRSFCRGCGGRLLVCPTTDDPLRVLRGGLR